MYHEIYIFNSWLWLWLKSKENYNQWNRNNKNWEEQPQVHCSACYVRACLCYMKQPDSGSDCDGEFMMNGVPRMLWHSSSNIPCANGRHVQPIRSLYYLTFTNQKPFSIIVTIIPHIWGHLGRGNCCTLGTLGGVNVCYCWLLPPVHRSHTAHWP